jgi:hypothetical protein
LLASEPLSEAQEAALGLLLSVLVLAPVLVQAWELEELVVRAEVLVELFFFVEFFFLEMNPSVYLAHPHYLGLEGSASPRPALKPEYHYSCPQSHQLDLQLFL